MRRPLLVVAAVIERDGEILICQRQAGDSHEYKWEFPGGKVEAGETPKAALERELVEELAIQANIGEEIARYEFHYPGRPPILILFHRVREFEGTPMPNAFEQIRWEQPDELPGYDFLDGDKDFVKRLARGEYRPRVKRK